MKNFRRLATTVTAGVGAAILTLGLAAPAQAQAPTTRTRGAVEVATPGWGRIHVQGWAFDPRRSAASSSLDIVVDGKMAALPLANRARADVEKAFRITGNHGYYLYLPASVGTHKVCIVARPVAGSGSTWSILGCTTLTVTHA